MRKLVIQFAFWLLWLADYDMPMLVAYVPYTVRKDDLNEQTAEQAGATVN